MPEPTAVTPHASYRAASVEVLEAHATEMLGIFQQHHLVRATDHELPELDLEAAYEVQGLVIARRTAAGERPVGFKVGCTSRAVQSQFGLHQPIHGRVMAPHVHPSGSRLDVTPYVACAIEPEFVLHLAHPIDASDTSDDALRAAIRGVSPGIEVHEHRFFHGAPSSQELVASNGLHTELVVSDEVHPVGGQDLALEGIGVWRNGELVASGIGAEIQGGPLESLRWLVQELERREQTLDAGSIVIPGSATALIDVDAGDHVEVRFTHFGACHASFLGERRVTGR